MKTALSILLLLLAFNAGLAQSKKKDIIPLITEGEKLYVVKKSSLNSAWEAKRLRRNETVRLMLNEGKDTLYAMVLIWDKQGLYYTPYREVKDSIKTGHVDQMHGPYMHYVHDSVIYVQYSEIYQIDFRQNLRKRIVANLAIASFGGVFFSTPLVLSLLLTGGYTSFSPVGFAVVGAGGVLCLYSWWRLKALQKLKQYPMSSHEFMLK